MDQKISINTIFFGSTSDSVTVLNALITHNSLLITPHISAVVTQPPKPVSRKQILTPTPVELWAKEHDIPVLTFPTDSDKPWRFQSNEDVINSITTFHPDLLVTASYGQKIPDELIQKCSYKALNVHPSLLPRWRGADPTPWTILSGDHETGATIVTLSEKFDEGHIISQKKFILKGNEFAPELRKKLFTMGAELLLEILPKYISGHMKGLPQKNSDATIARKLTRDDGYVSWDVVQDALEGKETKIFTMYRALSPWPGIWSTIPLSFLRKQESNHENLDSRVKPKNNKMNRMKILEAHEEHGKLVLDTVQLEGKSPVRWKEFKKSYM